MQINQPQNTVRYHAIFVLSNGISGELDIYANTDSEAYSTACKILEPVRPLNFTVFKESQQLKVCVEMPRFVRLPNLEFQVAWIDPTNNAVRCRQFPHKETAEQFYYDKKKGEGLL